jgi:hypothetical protein
MRYGDCSFSAVQEVAQHLLEAFGFLQAAHVAAVLEADHIRHQVTNSAHGGSRCRLSLR